MTMIKPAAVLLFILTLIFNRAAGQSFSEQFKDLAAKEDTLGQKRLLKTWEKSDSNDPELYAAYFNYYFIKSKKESIVLGQNPQGESVLQVNDQDTSDKEPAAYIYADTYYNPVFLNKGFGWADRGIAKFPDRLDMRLGKIYLLGQIKDYKPSPRRSSRPLSVQESIKTNGPGPATSRLTTRGSLC